MATKKQRSFRDVLGEIEGLRAQAEALRAAEISKVVADIKASISQYGLTAADLGLGGAPGRKPSSKVAAPQRTGRKAKASKVKFRDDKGNTWVGRGKRPDWFNAALAAGKRPEDFLVK